MLRVALVHDWLVAQRGGEHVLLELCKLFPHADIFTLVHKAGSVHPDIEKHTIVTSPLQKFPGAPETFRGYLPVFPWAIETLNVGNYDLVISSSHCVAKGVRTHSNQLHVAYVHTPMRYLWDQLEPYAPEWANGVALPLLEAAVTPLRYWDVRSAQRPDLLLANSQFVAQRIEKVWRRPAKVVYPPVDVDFFSEAPKAKRRGFAVVSALVPYKRVDLAVRYATEHREDLVVVGEGPEMPRLREIAGPTVLFQGSCNRQVLRDTYASAEALLFCGVEDFGIAPVEALASGCPVVAYAQGGVCESVGGHSSSAGVLFPEQTVDALAGAVRQLRERPRGECDEKVLRERAQQFSPKVFHAEIRRVLAPYFSEFNESR